MPDFTSLFLEEVKKKKLELLKVLSKNLLDFEDSFKNYFRNHWHSLFEKEFKLPSYAIDASQRILPLAFGPYHIISQGIILGENSYEKAEVSIDILEGTISKNQLEFISDIILQNLEINLALKAVNEENPPYALFIDGSLSSRISHLLYLLDIDLNKYNTLVYDVLKKTLDLVKISKEKGIYLISISKVSRDTFLSQIISESEGKTIESKLYFTDSELISYFTKDVGYSTPILLGGKRILGKKQWDILNKNYTLKDIFEDINAFINIYIRLIPNDQPLRIDFPCYLIKRDDIFLNSDYQILPQVDIRDIISLIKNNCADLNVYQTHLYLVDRLVRIRREPDLERYILILEKELGRSLPVDRSQRRFI
jgi:hypothetical protein